MDMVKEFQKFFEDNAKKMSDLFSNFSASNPMGEWTNTFFKDFMSQTKEMVTGLFQNDVYNKMMKDMETYKKEIMDKFAGLTGNMGDFNKIQKQFESFVTENSKKFLDMTNSTFKESYEKMNKSIMENLGKFDFSKFFQANAAEKKTTASTGTKKA